MGEPFEERADFQSLEDAALAKLLKIEERIGV
jgi:hypothetical protein